MRDENRKSSGTTRMPRLCGRTHGGPTLEGITPDGLRVEAIRKGHRHKTTQEKLREVVEVAKTFEATAFANQLMKTARNTQQEQNQIAPVVTVLLVRWETSTTRQQHCPAMGKIVQKAASLAPSHASAGVEPGDKLDSSKPILCYTTLQFARKYFAKLHLIHGEKTKVVKAQMDSASTCNTIPCSLLRKLFANAEIRRTRTKINTYGSETMRPEGQVTLC